MRNLKLLCVGLLSICCLFFVIGCSGKGPSLSIDKSVVKPGEEIAVSFTALAEWNDNAWIGIVPSEVPHGSEATNDQYDLAYQYIKKRTSGTMKFKAPTTPGKYDFRMHDTDNNGKEITHITFEVKP